METRLQVALDWIERSSRKSSVGSAWACAENAAEEAGLPRDVVTAIGGNGGDKNYPDLVGLENMIRAALDDSPIIVTRHQTLVDWLAARGITGTVIEHVSDAAQIRGRRVIGILPLSLAAEAASVVSVEMPGLTLDARKRVNGGDFTVAEMDAWGAHLEEFEVRRILRLEA